MAVYDTITVYRKWTGVWRWDYQVPFNDSKLAVAGQSYSNIDDALADALRACGLPSSCIGVKVNTLVSRADRTQVLVRFRH